jgi:lactoylglutathione lyase
MHIAHVALFTEDIERSRAFYAKYFSCRAGEKYANAKTGFESCFLDFASGARLEIMKKPGEKPAHNAHFAVSAGNREAVIALTETLRGDGFAIASAPRVTGDGYFESCVLDPDGNKIEITE